MNNIEVEKIVSVDKFIEKLYTEKIETIKA